MIDVEVSVIMAVRDGARYLEDALDSVFIQRLPKGKRLEVIFIDDASSDGTGDIAERYAEKYDGVITVIHNEVNLGVAASRNMGIKMARGKYIAFLDGDDVWHKDKLKVQLEMLEETGCVMSATSRVNADESGCITGGVFKIPNRVSYRRLLKSNTIACSSVLALAGPVKEFGMEHDELHEDYILWLKILQKYGPCAGVTEPYVTCRLVGGGRSREKLNSASRRFKVYRLMGLNLAASVFYFCCYAVTGVCKYRGINRK
ncbi:MAG: glycosyltransferase [Eubacterium sp.]|nr:glycosyltransferase [Eubacterium sp.]